VWQVPKPVGRPMGIDALPAALRASRILTGNDLGRLANCAERPDPGLAEAKPSDPPDARGLEEAIQRALAREDLAEAWRLAGRLAGEAP